MKIKEIVNKKTLLGSFLAAISFEVFLGTVIGYFVAKFFSGSKTGASCPTDFFQSLKFNLGKYKIHLHHWFICSLLLFSVLIWHYLPVSKFSFGLVSGLIFQGIYCYDDWKDIIKKDRQRK